jgi:hypothetical protein
MAILTATAVITPLCLLPDLSALAPMAYVGVAAVAYSAVSHDAYTVSLCVCVISAMFLYVCV